MKKLLQFAFLLFVLGAWSTLMSVPVLVAYDKKHWATYEARGVDAALVRDEIPRTKSWLPEEATNVTLLYVRSHDPHIDLRYELDRDTLRTNAEHLDRVRGRWHREVRAHVGDGWERRSDGINGFWLELHDEDNGVVYKRYRDNVVDTEAVLNQAYRR